MNSHLLRDEDRWTKSEVVIFGRLWLEFLALSPSYELARKHRNDTLSADDQKRIPVDFERVLEVYDDLGDVQKVDFKEWWKSNGLRSFGYEGEMSRVTPIDILFRDDVSSLETIFTYSARYMKGRWAEEGQQPTAILAVPLSLGPAEISQQIAQLMPLYGDKLKDIHASPPKYKLFGTKRDRKSLIRYLKCLVTKAAIPEMKLHEVGAVAGISTTYSDRVLSGHVEDHEALKVLTSRALTRGVMIAENAARGIFPTYDRCEHAVAPDWEELSGLTDEREDGLDEAEWEALLGINDEPPAA